MRKLILVFCLLMCLCACKDSNANINKQLDNVFNNINDIKEYHTNNTMKYFSYYLPSDMHEDDLDSDSIVLKYNDSTIIMNLNIANIINSKYYNDYILTDESLFDKQYSIYKKQGSFKNFENDNKRYICDIYNYDDTYVLFLQSSDMNYLGNIDIQDADEVVKHLLTICKNTTVSKEEVIKDYSNKDVIDYTKKQINLFDVNMPVNGALADLLVDGAIVADGIYIENNPSDSEEINEIPYE